MKYVLVLYLLSSGLHYETYSTLSDCKQHLREYQILAKSDLWSAVCAQPEDLQGETELARHWP